MSIHIELRVTGGALPSAEDLRLRYELEDWIHDNHIGQVVDAGAGRGVMDLYVEPEDDHALKTIERHIVERGLAERASVTADE